MGPGERALFITKKLRVDQFKRDGSTVDRDKGGVFSLAGGVDRTCKEFLAGPRLPLDQYGQIPLRQSLRHRDYTLHSIAAVNDAGELRRCWGQSLDKACESFVSLLACNWKELSGQVEWNNDRTHAVFTRGFDEVGPVLGFRQQHPDSSHGRGARAHVKSDRQLRRRRERRGHRSVGCYVYVFEIGGATQFCVPHLCSPREFAAQPRREVLRFLLPVIR